MKNLVSYVKNKEYETNFERYFRVTLLFFVLIGLWFKLISYTNIILDSDAVQFGIYSNSILHGNFLFHEVYLSNTGNYIAETYVFHLIPQILSNFNPLVLKISFYAIFVLALIVFSILIFDITQNKSSVLIFAALCANLDSGAFSCFMLIAKMWSVFICGLSLLVIWYIVKNQDCIKSKNKTFVLITLLTVLISLASYSDPYLLFCLIVPICGSYLLFYKNKNLILNILFSLLFISSALTYLFGNRIIESVIPDPPRFIQYNQLALESVSQIIPNFIFYVQGIAYLLNDNLYQIGEHANPLNLCVSALLLIIGGYLVVVYLQKTEADLFFKYFLITGFLFIFIFYVFTSMSSGFMTTRYLVFPAIAILLGISLSYSPKRIDVAALILILLIISAMGSITSGQKFESDANPNQTELIQFLTDNNLYYGYSDYWDANLITYLSKFKIMVRSLAIHANDSVETYPYNNNDNWYTYPEGADVFMLTSKPGYSINDDNLNQIIQVDPPINKMRCNEYSIYVW